MPGIYHHKYHAANNIPINDTTNKLQIGDKDQARKAPLNMNTLTYQLCMYILVKC